MGFFDDIGDFFDRLNPFTKVEKTIETLGGEARDAVGSVAGGIASVGHDVSASVSSIGNTAIIVAALGFGALLIFSMNNPETARATAKNISG